MMQKLDLPARFDAVAPEAAAIWNLFLQTLNDNPRDPDRGWLFDRVWLDQVDLPGCRNGIDVRPLTSDAWVLRYVVNLMPGDKAPLVVYHHCEYAGDRDALLRHLAYENSPSRPSDEFDATLSRLFEKSQQPSQKEIAEMEFQTFRALVDENDRYGQEIARAYLGHQKRLDPRR